MYRESDPRIGINVVINALYIGAELFNFTANAVGMIKI